MKLCFLTKCLDLYWPDLVLIYFAAIPVTHVTGKKPWSWGEVHDLSSSLYKSIMPWTTHIVKYITPRPRWKNETPGTDFYANILVTIRGDVFVFCASMVRPFLKKVDCLFCIRACLAFVMTQTKTHTADCYHFPELRPFFRVEMCVLFSALPHTNWIFFWYKTDNQL